MHRFILICLLTMKSLWASGVGAEILWLKGNVTYENQKLVEGATIPLGLTLKTAKKSFVKVQVPSVGGVKGFQVVLGPDSALSLSGSPEQKDGEYKFIKGAARFIHEQVNDSSKSAPIISPQVSIAVRGTEYLLKVNPALGESEIILFEGEVQMVNLSDPNNSISINPGQWGGLGGRFGSQIAPPISLPKEVFSGFKKLLKK